MHKLATLALLAATALAVGESQAQVLFTRPGSGAGFGRNPIFPFGGWGGGYGTGPFGTGPFGGGTFGPQIGPAPNAPGYSGEQGVGMTGRMTGSQQNGNQPREGITGHPTRFLSYGHYFLNQGGGTQTGTTGSTTVGGGYGQPATGALVGGEYARSLGGTPPQRPARPQSGGRR